MPLIAAHDIDAASGNMAIYNGLDCCLTYEVDQVRQDLRRNDTLIYDFERAMQGPALEMQLRGFRVDIAERENAISVAKGRQAATERILSQIIKATGSIYNSKLPNSPKQLQDLLYTRMKLKPIERHEGGRSFRFDGRGC